MRALEQELNEEFERSTLVLEGRFSALSRNSSTVFGMVPVKGLFLENDDSVWSLLSQLDFGSQEANQKSCEMLCKVTQEYAKWCE
jgi:hypothetical protein